MEELPPKVKAREFFEEVREALDTVLEFLRGKNGTEEVHDADMPVIRMFARFIRSWRENEFEQIINDDLTEDDLAREQEDLQLSIVAHEEALREVNAEDNGAAGTYQPVQDLLEKQIAEKETGDLDMADDHNQHTAKVVGLPALLTQPSLKSVSHIAFAWSDGNKNPAALPLRPDQKLTLWQSTCL